jgi:nitroimidazol reductase NimA-like FMN-containing flavoprotein (pyridoxamine 5'-phosphate oxidase superfamily)
MNCATDQGVEVLTTAECWNLLSSTSIGRIALTRGALPVVYPVQFALSECMPVFRLHAGTLLNAAASSDVVCFEADSVIAPAWSVLLTGRLNVIVDNDRLSVARDLPILPWAAGGAGQFAELRAELVSGRRLHVEDSDPRR